MPCFSPFFPAGAARVPRFCIPFVLAAALALAACRAAPDSVMQDFYKAAAAGRMEEAVGYFSVGDVAQKDQEMVKRKLATVVDDAYSTIQKHGGLASIDTKVALQTVEKAEVEVALHYKDGTGKREKQRLRKEGGRWEIQLTMFALGYADGGMPLAAARPAPGNAPAPAR